MSKKNRKNNENALQESTQVNVNVTVKETNVKKQKTKIKKKRGCCFHCCMTLLVFNFVLTCLLIGVGWFFGDQFSRQYLDMPLTQTFGVFRGITHSNGKFIEKDHAPAQGDEQAFYDNLGNALLLKSGTIDADELKQTVINVVKNEGNVANELTDYAIGLIERDENGKVKLDQNKIRLAADGDQEVIKMRIPDKQLAAFINGIVGGAVDGYVMDMLKDAGLDSMGLDVEKLNIKDYIKAEQIKLYIENRLVNNTNTNVNMVKFTVSVDFKTALKDAKKAFDVKQLVASEMPDLQQFSPIISVGAKAAIDIVKMILPSKLYLTIDMGLSHSVEPALYINDMGNDKMDNMYRLLEIMDLNIKSQIDDLFVSEDGMVKKAIDTANEKAPLSRFLGEGAIVCDDVYQYIIDAANLNKVGEDEPEKQPEELITSKDIFKVLNLVLDDEKYNTYINTVKSAEYSYKSYRYKTDENGNIIYVNGEPQFDFGAEYYVTDKDEIEKRLADYEKLIIDAFSSGYGLKAEKNVDDIIKTFSSESIDTDKALEMFDPDRIKEIINNDAKGVTITDKMLAALVAKMMPEKAAAFDLSNIGVEFIFVQDKISENNKHQLLNVGLNLDVYPFVEKLSNNELITKVVKNLIPPQFIVGVALDITIGQGEDFEYLPTEIQLNGDELDAVVNKLLMTFGALKNEDGEKVSLSTYLGEMLNPIRTTLNNLDKTLPGLSISSSGLKLPDVYVALGKVINQNKQEGEDGYIETNKIKDVLQLLIANGPLAEGSNSKYAVYNDENAMNDFNAACREALMTELNEHMAIEEINAETGEKYTITEILKALGIVKTEEGEVKKEIYDLISSEKLKGLAGNNDSDWQNTLKVNITNRTLVDPDSSFVSGSDMLTVLLKEIITSSDYDFSMLGKEFDIKKDMLFVKLSENESKTKQYLTIVVKARLADMITDSSASTNEFITKLLPNEMSLIAIKVDITLGDEHEKCDFIFNDDIERSGSLHDVLDALGVKIDFERVGSSIRTAINQIRNNNVADVEIFGSGVKIDNLFSIMSRKFEKDNKVMSSTEVKWFMDSFLNSEIVVPTQNDDFRNWYYKNGDAGDMQYGDENGTLTAVDFGEVLNDELLDIYALKTQNESGEKYTLKDTMTIFGLGESSDVDILDRVDSDKLEERVDDARIRNLKIDSRELGALVVANFGSFIDQNRDDIKEENILYAKVYTVDGESFMEICVKLNLTDKLDSDMDKFKRFMPEISTITLVIDITEGRGTEDNPYRDTEVKYNELNDVNTDRMLEDMNTLGASSNATNFEDIATSVRKSLSDLDNKVDISYGEDTMDLPNLFAVINKMVLKVEHEDSEIKAALKGIYSTSETVVGGNKKIDTFENGIDAIAPNEDYSSFINAIKNKYYLKGNAANVNTFDDIFSYVGVRKLQVGDDIQIANESQDGELIRAGLAYDIRNIDSLKPMIEVGDLGAIMREKIPSGDYTFHSMTIDTSNGTNKLTMYVSIPMLSLFKSSSDSKMSNLINVNTVYAVIETVINEENLRSKGDGDSDNETYYYDCIIRINKMNDNDNGTFMDIMGSFSNGGQDADMQKIEEDIGHAIYDAFNTLDTSFDGNYTISDNGIELCDVFTLLKSIIVGKESTLEAADIQKALQGMYAYDSLTAQNPNNYVEENIIVNEISSAADTEQNVLIAKILQDGYIIDRDLGAYANNKVTRVDTTIRQMSILAANADVASLSEKDRAYFAGLGYTLDKTADYVTMTVLTSVANFGTGEGDGSLKKDAKNLLPTNMFVTFILKYNSDNNKFELVENDNDYYFIINGMDNADRNVILELTGLDVTNVKDNIVKVSEDCLVPVNNLFSALASESSNARFEEASLETARGRYALNKD